MTDNTISNIQRRYRLLFTLPKIKIVVLLTALFSLPIPIISNFYSNFGITSSILAILSFLLALYASSALDLFFIKKNPLTTFRRVASISIFSNGLWSSTVLLGILVSIIKASEKSFFSFLIFGMLLAVTFRFFVFGSLFFNRLLLALPIAFIQPLSLIAPYTYSLPDLFLYIPAVATGLLIIFSTYIYLLLVDRSGGRFLKHPLQMLRAFVQAWAVDRPDAIEAIIEEMSSIKDIGAVILKFETARGRQIVVLPEAHPGPFYPIGSSNLPFELYRWFDARGYSPIVLHGISGHNLNLPSQRELQKYLSSLDNMKTLINTERCSHPVTVKVGNATASGVAFGDTALVTVTLSPNGMEDFPDRVKSGIEKIASQLSFKYVMTIDSHNSQGNPPSERECDSTVEAVEKALKFLKTSQQNLFKVGYAHSSEFETKFDRDVGPAGISILVIEVEGRRYALIGVDANNMVPGLREKIINSFQTSKIQILDICTSDTHITAGKVMEVKGYLALGERTDFKKIIETLQIMLANAVERLAPAEATLDIGRTEVRVIGEDLLNLISKGLDNVTSFTKKGGISIILITVLLFMLIALI